MVTVAWLILWSARINVLPLEEILKWQGNSGSNRSGKTYTSVAFASDHDLWTFEQAVWTVYSIDFFRHTTGAFDIVAFFAVK